MKRISRRTSSIPFSGIREIMEYAKGLRDIIYLNIGEPDFITPKHIREAAKKAIDNGFTHYTPMQGIPELRQAISEKLKNENRIYVDPDDNIIVAAGTQAAFFALCQALLDPGDEVIVQDPFYPGYRISLEIAGVKIVPMKLKEEEDFMMNPDEILEKISRKTKMIILISPNNPTGSVLDRYRLHAIADIAQDHDLLVVSDELYEKIVYDNVVNYSIGSFPGMEDRTITINGFSKAYAMTGWRVGYLVASKEILRNILKVHNIMNVCASSISQRAALAALTGPQDCITEMVKQYDERRREMINLLNEIPGFKYIVPKGTFYIFANIKYFKIPSLEFAKFLIKKAKVVVTHGSAFGENGEGYLRFSYSTSIENIREAFSRIKKAVKDIDI